MSLGISLILATMAIGIVFLAWQRKSGTASTPEEQPSTEEAATQRSKAPSLALGIKAYMSGDHQRAEPILRQHAEAGSLKAQQLMAKMYYSGHGVPQDSGLYQHWLELAAAQGDRGAKARIKALRKKQDSAL